MSDQIVLDVLFGLIVILFAAIGFWRGAAKEAVVTAGILVGAELADRWDGPWGNDLREFVDIGEQSARLVVAGIALLTATIVLGYGGSAVVGATPSGIAGRLAGAVLSAVNGGLLLHYGLRFVEIHLDDAGAQRVLDESDVSRLLLREFGLLLVGAAGVTGTAVLVALVAGRRTKDVFLSPFESGLDSPPYTDASGRQRPARLPRGADDGKYEPVYRGYDPERQRYAADAPRVSETIPLPPVDPHAHDHDRYGGWERAAFSGDEWYRRAQAYGRSEHSSTDGHLRRSIGSPNGVDGAAEPSAHETTRAEADPSANPANGFVASAEAPPDAWPVSRRPQESNGMPAAPPHRLGARGRQPRHCRLCLAALGDSDSFCPSCGASAS